MVFWEISVELVPCRESRRPCSIKFLPTSQVEAGEVEIFLSSQSSRKVNVEKSSIMYSILVRTYNLQILKIEQGSTPRIDRNFLSTLHFVAIANVKRVHWASRLSPRHDQFFRPLNLVIVSVPATRRRDATPPSFSAIVLTTLKPHGLTNVDLRVVYTKYPDG
jgi:hypothetical protein